MSDVRPGSAADADEPAGSDADRLEQATGAAPQEPPAPRAPADVEVPVADAWEQAQPVAGEDDEDRRD